MVPGHAFRWDKLIKWIVDELNNPEFDEREVSESEAIGLMLSMLKPKPTYELATSYARSFVGTIYLVSLRQGWHFWRYYSESDRGRFLTRAHFADAESARRGMNLPAGNEGTLRQRVTVKYDRTTALRGNVRGGDPGVLQWLVFDISRLHFREGVAWYNKS